MQHETMDAATMWTYDYESSAMALPPCYRLWTPNYSINLGETGMGDKSQEELMVSLSTNPVE